MTSSTQNQDLEDLIGRRYAHGFVTDIESDTVPPGLSEDTIRFMSAKKGEPGFLLEWRLKAYRHWLTLREPRWAKLHHPPIDYQAISYYSAPKAPQGLKSIDEVDPKLLETYEKLGIPLHERARLAGVAVVAHRRSHTAQLAAVTTNSVSPAPTGERIVIKDFRA